jgi:hypothetical protein
MPKHLWEKNLKVEVKREGKFLEKRSIGKEDKSTNKSTEK